jgi:hypothetical protein
VTSTLASDVLLYSEKASKLPVGLISAPGGALAGAESVHRWVLSMHPDDMMAGTTTCATT